MVVAHAPGCLYESKANARLQGVHACARRHVGRAEAGAFFGRGRRHHQPNDEAVEAQRFREDKDEDHAHEELAVGLRIAA